MTTHVLRARRGRDYFVRLGVTAGTVAFAIAMGCAGGSSPNANVDSGMTNNPDNATDAGIDSSTVLPPGAFPSGLSGNVQCNPIQNGTNSLTVNGLPRQYDVQFPHDTSNMAVLFAWHGWMQNPTTFSNAIVYDVPSAQWIPFDPNGFNMPLMVITPYDQHLIPPFGLDWDIVSGKMDFPYFEGILKCIDQQFTIDHTRVYSFGFSAGAVFSNLLTAAYPHLFAATISESGTWFNDQPEWSDVDIPIIQWKWPAFSPQDKGNVLLTHGGSGDYATVISLEDANQKAMPFLNANDRTVMECAHTFGHTLDPDLTMHMYYEYMWAHQLGGAPLSGMISDWPTPTAPVGATQCRFHPAP
jgi:predicted esterase